MIIIFSSRENENWYKIVLTPCFWKQFPRKKFMKQPTFENVIKQFLVFFTPMSENLRKLVISKTLKLKIHWKLGMITQKKKKKEKKLVSEWHQTCPTVFIMATMLRRKSFTYAIFLLFLNQWWRKSKSPKWNNISRRYIQ